MSFNRGRGRGNQAFTGARRPTHFLALPIGHHRELRDAVHTFQHGLLRSSPAIPGLDSSIVVHPRRLHLTLGVMTLDSSSDAPTHGKSLRSALVLLNSLKPQIESILAGKRLFVGLDVMHVMDPERVRRSGDAHVLWMGPDMTTNNAKRLSAVCNLIHTTFRRHGFIVQDRPLKLHCTILNTSYRRNRREPFSYQAVLTSSALQSISTAPFPSTNAVPVNMGMWGIDEVQICVMGSHGAENEYISCGGISLVR